MAHTAVLSNFSIGQRRAGKTQTKRCTKCNASLSVSRTQSVTTQPRVQLSLHQSGATVGDARRNVTFVIRDSPMLSANAEQ